MLTTLPAPHATHAAEPTDAANESAAHAAHEAFPVVPCAKPAGQSVHIPGVLVLSYLPAEHASHPLEFALAMRPVGHALHVDEPAAAAESDGHSGHAPLCRYRPTSHEAHTWPVFAVQLEWPAATAVPPVQTHVLWSQPVLRVGVVEPAVTVVVMTRLPVGHVCACTALPPGQNVFGAVHAEQVPLAAVRT